MSEYHIGYDQILIEAESAYLTAREGLRARFPSGESKIALVPYYAYRYAKDVVKGPWPEGEPIIALDPWYAYMYAKMSLTDDGYLVS